MTDLMIDTRRSRQTLKITDETGFHSFPPFPEIFKSTYNPRTFHFDTTQHNNNMISIALPDDFYKKKSELCDFTLVFDDKKKFHLPYSLLCYASKFFAATGWAKEEKERAMEMKNVNSGAFEYIIKILFLDPSSTYLISYTSPVADQEFLLECLRICSMYCFETPKRFILDQMMAKPSLRYVVGILSAIEEEKESGMAIGTALSGTNVLCRGDATYYYTPPLGETEEELDRPVQKDEDSVDLKNMRLAVKMARMKTEIYHQIITVCLDGSYEIHHMLDTIKKAINILTKDLSPSFRIERWGSGVSASSATKSIKCSICNHKKTHVNNDIFRISSVPFEGALQSMEGDEESKNEINEKEKEKKIKSTNILCSFCMAVYIVNQVDNHVMKDESLCGLEICGGGGHESSYQHSGEHTVLYDRNGTKSKISEYSSLKKRKRL